MWLTILLQIGTLPWIPVMGQGHTRIMIRRRIDAKMVLSRVELLDLLSLWITELKLMN